MKANWKWALMGLAVVAMISCKSKNEPEDTTPTDPEEEYVQPISVEDNSLADWNALPAEFVFEAVCPEDAASLGLKKVKVYADKYYVFIQAEPDPETIVDLDWVPFHIYLNTDNSDKTGGYNDEHTDANCDVMLEGAVFGDEAATSLAEAAISYAPGVFKWWGEVGGTGWDYWTDPSTEHSADDGWGAIVAEGNLQECKSQFVDGIIEIQFMRELVPTPAGWSEEAFGIGFDIQQNWNSVGILPLVSPTDADPAGHTAKLTVKIDNK